MNIEFHYYITYLIALKAGFSHDKAYKIAYSSQFVDDNQKQVEVLDLRMRTVYRSTPTQIEILSIGKRRDEILQSHHFLPGDDVERPQITTPNCQLANTMLEMALEEDNPYLIGIASHAYVDTWAHQNFAGRKDEVNGMPGLDCAIIPNIGHADALDDPDSLDAQWHDKRPSHKKMIKNSDRFLDAAAHLCTHYHKSLHPNKSPDYKDLLTSLTDIFSKHRAFHRFNRNAMMQRRKKHYNHLAVSISGFDIPPYIDGLWREYALQPIANNNVTTGKYHWRKGINFATHDWWQFQEAAKDFQQKIFPIIASKYGKEINT